MKGWARLQILLLSQPWKTLYLDFGSITLPGVFEVKEFTLNETRRAHLVIFPIFLQIVAGHTG